MWDLTCRNAEHLQLLMNLMGAGLSMYETLHNTKYPTKKKKQKKHQSMSLGLEVDTELEDSFTAPQFRLMKMEATNVNQ